jgi:hypothetical protein
VSADYQGVTADATNAILVLYFFDKDGPIHIYLPKAGLEQMCGRPLTVHEIDTILARHPSALNPLIDSVCKRCGGFTTAFWENGVGYRRLDISLEDITSSDIRLSSDALAMQKQAGSRTHERVRSPSPNKP